MAEGRRTFGPVVLVGLAAGAMTAVAGHRDWATATTSQEGLLLADTSGRVPLAGALSLVVLAAWGVLLVARGRARLVAAVFAFAGALGALATTVVGYWSAVDGVEEAFAAYGAKAPAVGQTAWYWIALVAAVVSVLATGAAVRFVRGWPEMGTRYDAPGTTPAVSETTATDLWKALDAGHDPTLQDEKRSDP